MTIIPAIKAILDSPDLRLDGFLGPATSPGDRHAGRTSSSRETTGKPVVIAGFEPLDIMQSMQMLLRQIARRPLRSREPVHPRGAVGRQHKALEAIRGRWSCARTSSGAAWASSRNPRSSCATSTPAWMPSALRDSGHPRGRPQSLPVRRSAQGRDQALGVQSFGTACTPETPIGTCMVSSEGACAAYYNFGRFTREREREAVR